MESLNIKTLNLRDLILECIDCQRNVTVGASRVAMFTVSPEARRVTRNVSAVSKLR